jgi:type II secretory pathway pseudopilin PulG
MVAVAILGVLVSLAVPNFLDWNRRANLRDGVSTMSWNLNLARMNAVNQNAVITVTVCQGLAVCPVTPAPGIANPAPAQVTVFFQNIAPAVPVNVIPPMTMPPGITLTSAVGGAVTAPQDINFSPLGLKQDTGNGNNLCPNLATGAYQACGNAVPQSFNFTNVATAYNYKVVVLQTGKVTWCTDAVFCQ